MLAPNVTLALEILRMPTLELRAFLEHQLEENPLLEMDESDDAEEEQPPDVMESNGTDEPTRARLDEEWLSHWQGGEATDDPDANDAPLIEQRPATTHTLYESLRLQLGCQPLSDEERRLGLAIIHHLDEYGYLEVPLDRLATEFGASVEQMGAALRLIQRFDPPGVGARDLRECLMIQLEHREACESLAYRILRDHFQHFAKNSVGTLAKATGVPREQVLRACEDLRRLDPKPGRAFAGDLPPSIVPDLIIHSRERHYDVELNDEDVPHVKINRAYYRMLRDPQTPADAKEFLANRFRRATWLVKAIDERNATLLSIARCLISLQSEFLEHGPRATKPLTQAQVARLIGRHASTVSRAISGKTIDTPYGIFRLEQLFASGIPQAARSETISDETVKSEIRHLLTTEDPQHPLSDAGMTKRLAQRNILVARRTIAKYRTTLKILPAYLRKHRF